MQGLWIGDALSQVEQICIVSFLKNGHEFHLYTYQPLQGVPDGVVIKDANKIIAEQKIFLYADRASYAGFADWFRWKLLYEKGNFYVDLDVVCLKPFDFKEDLIFAEESKRHVGTAVLGFPAKHWFCKYMAARCENPIEARLKAALEQSEKKSRHFLISYLSKTKHKLNFACRKFIWATVGVDKSRKTRMHQAWGEFGGPYGFTNALRKFGLLHLAKHYNYFYPLGNYSHPLDNSNSKDIKATPKAFSELIDAKTLAVLEQSHGIHLENYYISTTPADKNNIPHESVLGRLKQKYLG